MKGEYTFTRGRITIVAITAKNIKKDKNLYIGVSLCGKGETYREETGLSIARNRARIQPFANIPHSSKRTFKKYICPLIVSHIRTTNKWQPNLPRVDTLPTSITIRT